MKIKYLILLLLIAIQCCKSQENTNAESIKKSFLEEQVEIGTPIWQYLRSNPYKLNSLSQIDFAHKIDSLKKIQTTQLNKYKGVKLQHNVYRLRIKLIDSYLS